MAFCNICINYGVISCHIHVYAGKRDSRHSIAKLRHNRVYGLHRIRRYNRGTTIINSERIVGLETIIPTLYKYYKENYTVIFRYNNNDGENSYIPLYETQTNIKLWSGYGTEDAYINRYYDDDYDTRVCAFDVDEETRRHEPWTGGTDYYKQNLDMFLSGGIYTYPDGSGNSYDYGKIIGKGGFVEKFKEYQFRESLGEYTYNSVSSDDVAGATDVKGKTKRVIIYTLINE